ncbi:aldo/keto reductase [Dehalococcoidia bacterium]|nr:aldo/keto reductase [Dehalococcoidia bacterium]
MRTKKMGRTGLDVSEVCLGTMTFGWQCDERTSRGIMDAAFEAGISFFDTADVYPMGGSFDDVGKTEEIIGRWMKGKRHNLVLGTKVRNAVGRGPNQSGLSRRHIKNAIDASLLRLGTDYIDLYQTHSVDWDTPLEETQRVLDDLVNEGKVRYLGCSKYPAWLVAKSLWVSEKNGLARFECVQPRYNVLVRDVEDELYPLCQDQGLGVIPFNPLAGGVLSGKYAYEEGRPQGSRLAILEGVNRDTYEKWYWHADQLGIVQELKAFFSRRGKNMIQVALAWVLKNRIVTAPIVGASSTDQLTDTLGGLDIDLDEDEMALLDAVWFRLPRQRDYGVATGSLRV